MTQDPYTCTRAQKELIELVDLIGKVGLLQLIPDEGVLRQCVQECDPCRRRRGPKRCQGWHLEVPRGILTFGPLTFPGDHQIRIELSADCDFQRPQPGRQEEWDASPLASSTLAFEVFDLSTEQLIERHHLDLANPPSPGAPGQPGPVWHLQLGGNPAGTHSGLPTSWLTVPRWPTPPMDLTLAIEFLAYSFFPEKWDELNERGEWLRLVMGVEQLIVSRFAQHMWEHFGRDPRLRDHSWLAAQDNRGDFNPRP